MKLDLNPMAHVMNQTMNAVLGDPGVVEDRNLLPPDVPDAEPITDQMVACLVEKLKGDKSQVEDLCVDISYHPSFPDMVDTCWEDPALAGHLLQLLAKELLESKARKQLENPVFAREQAE